MSDANSNEIWQVDVSGQVYEANFAELTDWIADGAVQPDDKVRHGNLRWIEARKVPSLVEFFNAKASGLPAPVVVVTTTEAAGSDESYRSPVTAELPSLRDGHTPVNASTVGTGAFQEHLRAEHCEQHPDRPATFICLACSRPACRECVSSFGSSVFVCSACGGMCKPKVELEADTLRQEFRNEYIEKGFGVGDFATAIAYPFRFKASLFFGALMFMFFSLGRGASSFGGMYMIVASIFSYMLANMLAFGILSNTIENFAGGRITSNFMPNFDDFSLWDDVVHPFFLSIGVYISSFGPFLAVFLLGTYLVMSSISSQMDSMKANLEQTPGTPYYSARDTVDQSEQVKDVLNKTKEMNQQRLDTEQNVANGQQPAALDQQEENFEQINKMIADSKQKELESVVGKTAETRQRESAAFFNGLLRLAAPLVVIGFIAFLWGLFFFPAACTVAGYTKSFVATVNPLVGLDTIKRLGLDYVKILLMSLLLLVAFAIVSTVFSFIFIVFDMPGVGNLPARALDSLVWFYLVIVFACVIGLALFKSSDRLRLYS